MRGLVILICLGLLAAPGVVSGKPLVAVTPFENDAGDKVRTAVAEALAGEAKLIAVKQVRRAMDKLGVSGELDVKDAKKLRAQLDAQAVVSGSVEKDGKKRTVRLVVFTQGKKKGSKLSLSFKTSPTAKFRRDVRAEVMQRIGEPAADDDGGEAVAKRPAKRKQIAVSADDEDDDGDGDGEAKLTKKKREPRRGADGEVGGDEPARARHAITQAAIRVDFGGSFGLRQLTYIAAMSPPKVSTGSGGGRLEAELYPFAATGDDGPLGGLGLVGDYDRTIGLSIQIPGTETRLPIAKSHYSLGGRYRFAISGGTTIGAGVGIAKRQYAADRAGGMIDMPDVDYTAVAPRIALRVPLAPTAALFVDGGVLLMLATGPIQRGESFGRADVFGFEARGGVDVAFAKQYGLRVLAELSQIDFAFKGTGAVASQRGVTNATDRSIGLAATFLVLY